MTKDEIVAQLKSRGVNKSFKPMRDPNDERERWIISSRRGEIYIDEGRDAFRVWTSQKKLAKAIAAEHGLKVRLLDGEAEVWIPWALGDALLPVFGAKVKRVLSPEAAKQARERGLNLRSLRQKSMSKPVVAR